MGCQPTPLDQRGAAARHLGAFLHGPAGVQLLQVLVEGLHQVAEPDQRLDPYAVVVTRGGAGATATATGRVEVPTVRVVVADTTAPVTPSWPG